LNPFTQKKRSAALKGYPPHRCFLSSFLVFADPPRIFSSPSTRESPSPPSQTSSEMRRPNLSLSSAMDTFSLYLLRVISSFPPQQRSSISNSFFLLCAPRSSRPPDGGFSPSPDQEPPSAMPSPARMRSLLRSIRPFSLKELCEHDHPPLLLLPLEELLSPFLTRLRCRDHLV